MSNVGRWDRVYSLVTERRPYGDDTTYRLGADHLAPCSLVEDWGCGMGWMREHIGPDRYRGIDGSQTPYADEVVDLATYRSQVPGVFLRHVLEHDYRWAQILDNAAASATERLVVVLFTPLAETTHKIGGSSDPDVPDIAFRLGDMLDLLDEFDVTVSHHETDTQYRVETMLACTR